jgi:hypothetical protein
MRAGLLAVLLGVAACATTKVTSETSVHPSFPALRPAMVSVAAEGAAPAFGDALYRGLLAKDYSAIAPGAPPGSDTGQLRARLLTAGAPWSAEVVFEDPFGTVLYRSRIDGYRGALPDLAAALLLDLPPK